MFDVLVAGGGPAGLALSAAGAKRGLQVAVLEKDAFPRDKPCGEGLMPFGLRVLDVVGARNLIRPEHRHLIRGIRYIQEDGAAVEGRLPGEGGLGVRRTELSRALSEAARRHGAQLESGAQVLSFATMPEGVRLETTRGTFEGRMVVVADGLHSPLRRHLGIEVRAPRPYRFGMRRHFRLRPWSSEVEVFFSADAEAYVTPVGPQSVGVAFLWDERARGRASLAFDALLSRFPLLAEKVRGAEVESTTQGAGPLRQDVKRIVTNRVALLGDAAGYVDAITGEGISLALASAMDLADVLPDALTRGCTPQSLRPYERTHRRRFRQYALLAGSLLAIARRPALRRWVLHRLAKRPAGFELLLRELLPQ